jgi:SAM-dependent methyltransferase
VRSQGRNATLRFSDRVAYYQRYRPSYPTGLIDVLTSAGLLRPDSAVADVGSGTGKLAELFLRNGNRVVGVEPNREMREAGDALLAGHAGFSSVDGTAEATTLADDSVDLVACGQAFHWFDRGRAAEEFRRILRRDGGVAIVWNIRRIAGDPFMEAYENLLDTYGTDYHEVGHHRLDADSIREFFGPDGYELHVLDYVQTFDYAGLEGRLLSSSYAPAPGHPRHPAMVRALRALFDEHARQGRVTFGYDTKLYRGRLSRTGR